MGIIYLLAYRFRKIIINSLHDASNICEDGPFLVRTIDTRVVQRKTGPLSKFKPFEEILSIINRLKKKWRHWQTMKCDLIGWWLLILLWWYYWDLKRTSHDFVVRMGFRNILKPIMDLFVKVTATQHGLCVKQFQVYTRSEMFFLY